MKELIKQKLKEIAQRPGIRPNQDLSMENCNTKLFGEDEEAIKKYCRENEGILEISKHRTFNGVVELFGIIDEELKDYFDIETTLYSTDRKSIRHLTFSIQTLKSSNRLDILERLKEFENDFKTLKGVEWEELYGAKFRGNER
jgi:hypothetical protein